MPRDYTISFKVSEQTYYQLKERAEKRDRTVSEVVRDAITGYFEEPVRREIQKHEERTEKLYQELTKQWQEQVTWLRRIVELLEVHIKSE